MYKRTMRKKYQDLLEVNMEINKDYQELLEKAKRFKQKITRLALLLEKKDYAMMKSLMELYLMENLMEDEE